MSDDLVKRARHNALADMPHYASAELIETLADRIEELEANLSEQIEWVKSLADDLIAAEGREARLKEKLAKAVEALGTALSEMVDYADTHPAWSEIWEAREAARTTLAELTGDKDE